VVAILITLHYFFFSLLFFSSGVGPALDIINAFAAEVLALSTWSLSLDVGYVALLLALPLIAVLGLWYQEAVVDFCDQFGQRLISTASSLQRLVPVKTVVVTVVLLSLWALEHKDAVVVYMRF
jgi:hypothetical protein